MPIANIQDAQEVEHSFQTILSTPEVNARLRAIRSLFVETLDFDLADQQISLNSAGNDQLPGEAHIVARRDGVSLVYISLDNASSNRVTGAIASAVAKTVGNVLGDDLLLLFTNRDRDQLHVVNPDLTGSRPRLQRIVAHKDQLQRTVVQQIANMWDNYGNRGKTIREAITIAFSVEPVTKQFFEIYHSIFKNAEDQITGFEDDDQKHLFTQTIFNRLMFVYFLSRKGWLKFKGNTNYLNALWQDHNSLPDQGNFYNSRIKPLFFSGLNNPESKDLTQELSTLIGDVPFLNGGLFEEMDLDKRVAVNVPNGVIEQILTDLFDRFNFTVMESTPCDQEVAVDPEMLGKVFEELVTGRHDSGAYYTPRTVVSFMCREALKGYLECQSTGLTPEAIANFVDDQRTDGIPVAQARQMAEALGRVTVVDPACGSGAYLLGMMQELIELQTALYNAGADAKAIYDLKLEIIQRNLHGVDIDEFAVNIAMLRLWLSLAIDYEGDKPEPLPNLDFKVLCGDSLLGPDPSAGVEVQGTLGQDIEQLQRLGQLKSEYMRASAGQEKKRLRAEIAGAKERLIEALGGAGVQQGVVDWRVEFSEIFAERQGFDIAIANPPYVRHEKIGINKAVLGQQYKEAVTLRPDLYCYFYARSLQLVTGGGMQVFVCSNSWLDSQYGLKLQEYLLNQTRIRLIMESAVERQFSTAAINTIISVIEKTPSDSSDKARFVSLRGEFEVSNSHSELRREITISKLQLVEAQFGEGKWGGKYLRAPDIYHSLVETASRSNFKLSDFVRGERYLNTGGADGFFILTDVLPARPGFMKAIIRSKEGLEKGTPQFLIETQFLRPGYRRNNSNRLEIDVPDCYILAIPPHVDLQKFEVSKYIEWGEDVGFNQRSVTRSNSPWWRPPLQAQTGATLLWPRTHSQAHRCYHNPNRFISLRFFRLHPIQEETTIPLLAVLNSTVFALLKEIHGRRALGQGALETGLVDILPLPFIELNDGICTELTEAIQPLMNRVVGKVEDEIHQFDRQRLDRLVLKSYGLSPDSIEDVYESVVELVSMRLSKAENIV